MGPQIIGINASQVYGQEFLLLSYSPAAITKMEMTTPLSSIQTRNRMKKGLDEEKWS